MPCKAVESNKWKAQAEIDSGLSSVTAAAGAILGKTKGINGKRWWGLTT
jgi:hypothetical protein